MKNIISITLGTIFILCNLALLTFNTQESWRILRIQELETKVVELEEELVSLDMTNARLGAGLNIQYLKNSTLTKDLKNYEVLSGGKIESEDIQFFFEYGFLLGSTGVFRGYTVAQEYSDPRRGRAVFFKASPSYGSNRQVYLPQYEYVFQYYEHSYELFEKFRKLGIMPISEYMFIINTGTTYNPNTNKFIDELRSKVGRYDDVLDKIQ